MTSILDLFCTLEYEEQRFDLLRKVAVTGDERHRSLWDRLLLVRYENYMPKSVSRMFHYAVDGPRSDLNLLVVHFLYFLMLGHEPYCQIIVMNELKEAGDLKRAEFFNCTFLPEIQLYYEIMFGWPYTTETLVDIVHVLIARLKSSWRMQSAYNFVVTRDEEKRRMQKDKEKIETLRSQRQASKRSYSLAHIRRKNNSRLTPAERKRQKAIRERKELNAAAERARLDGIPLSTTEALIVASSANTLNPEERATLKMLRKADAVAARAEAKKAMKSKCGR